MPTATARRLLKSTGVTVAEGGAETVLADAGALHPPTYRRKPALLQVLWDFRFSLAAFCPVRSDIGRFDLNRRLYAVDFDVEDFFLFRCDNFQDSGSG